jgi:triphosphoribosyl-dephospho-CoA synthase
MPEAVPPAPPVPGPASRGPEGPEPATPRPAPDEQFRRACRLDVAVRKPGNVSAASPGHGMDAGLFLASARVAATGLFAAGAPVGARIEAAVAATLAAAGCNTNLGILLLCAPLARALESAGPAATPAGLRAALEAVLAALDVADARAAFRAIAAAHPGGLGRAEAQDVHEEPTVTLREAMRLAAPRDRIALQYANGYADLFDLALPALAAALPPERRVDARAVQALYLALLAGFPDAHIVRKHGAAAAQAVTAEAAPWRARAQAGEALDADPAFAAWDESLKARGLNPGTSADLTVAALFIAGTTGIAILPV